MTLHAKPRRKVLIVDDEPEIRELFGEVLEAAGWHVETAPDGDEAMLMYSLSHYDLIVLDWDMPGMSGADFHAQISRIFGYGKRVAGARAQRLPPVLMVTGHYDRESVQRMLFSERIVGVLRKPLPVTKLAEVAEELWIYEERQRERLRKATHHTPTRLIGGLL